MKKVRNEVIEIGEVEYVGTTFLNCMFVSVPGMHGEFVSCDFIDCTLSHIEAELDGCTMDVLTAVNCGVTMRKCSAVEIYCVMSSVDFTSCRIRKSRFFESELSLFNSDVYGSEIRGCSASGASVRGTKLEYCNIELNGAGVISSSKFERCRLSTALSLTECELDDMTERVHASRIDGRKYDFAINGKGNIVSGCRNFKPEKAKVHWSSVRYPSEARGKLYTKLIEWYENTEEASK